MVGDSIFLNIRIDKRIIVPDRRSSRSPMETLKGYQWSDLSRVGKNTIRKAHCTLKIEVKEADFLKKGKLPPPQRGKFSIPYSVCKNSRPGTGG